MSRNVLIVGGGIAGLTAAIYLARGGCKVTLFEKKRHLGGRAVTHLRHGFRFNLGPHAIYRAGLAARIYRELGVPVRGGSPKRSGIALAGSERYRLPASALSLLLTGILSTRAKLEAAWLLFRLPRLQTKPYESMTIRAWLDENVDDPQLRDVVAALIRVATYSSDETQSASTALDQLKLAMRGVIYVDEGWQKLVDGLHSHAVTSGVNFVTSSRVVGVEHDDAVRAVRLGGLETPTRNSTVELSLPDLLAAEEKGTRLPADTVLLAVDPATAHDLIGAAFSAAWASVKPVTVACLDVALRRLPNPKANFAVGIDAPLYYSVHSRVAQLGPRNGALIHAAKYGVERIAAVGLDDESGAVKLTNSARGDERDLEGLLDRLQPGWRDELVHRRFLPAMTVSNATRTVGLERPSPKTPIRGLYVAGDWVGSEGSLSDAALASARAAAQHILRADGD